MTRLPNIGEEEWGDVLNEFLLVSHNTDGTPRKDNPELLAGTVGLSDLKTTNLPSDPILKTPLLSHDGTDLVWKTSIEINVRDYGAVGDGVTDDTDAIQSAINAAGSGLVVFPSGVFMTTGVKIRNKGTALRGDGRFGTRIRRLSGTAPLIDMSGTGTNLGHLRYDTISNFQVDGNNMPGTLIRSYYADSCVYRELSFTNCPDVSTDFVEVWDTRFENCTWEHCGAIGAPATLFRNSKEAGSFGYSEDNTNQIYFVSCRWEGFRDGAIRLDGAANGSTKLLNGIFFVACKMETRVAAGPAFQVMSGVTVVFVNQLYIAIMGLDPGYGQPIDAIVDYASHLFMTNVYVQWGVGAGIANSTVHIVRAAPHMYHSVGAFYPTEDPAKSTIWVEPAATDVTISSLWVNRGIPGTGDYSKLLDSDPVRGLQIFINQTGVFRVTDRPGNRDLLKVDNNPTRPALHLLNGVDAVGFSDEYITEKWRIVGATGAVKFASGKFLIEPTKGYVGINSTPFTGIAMLIKPAVEGDRGIAVVRPTASSLHRLMEFQDETHNIQGLAIDSNGRPQAVGTPPRVTPGDQVSYANPRVQVRDVAGGVIAATKATPAAGTIATVTFSRAYAQPPLSIMITDQSTTPTAADLYVSDRTATSFTVSSRTVPRGGAIVSFDYVVIA
jgi:hypothetical protein